MANKEFINWEIQNAEIVSADKTETKNIFIKNGKFDSIQDELSNSETALFDAKDLFLYPALINSHDHLLASYSPKIGGKVKYNNWLSWDNELKSSIIFSERQTLDINDLYALGTFRNMLGATTTVMDHIPHFVNRSQIDDSVLRLVKDYSLSHSICSYHLGWGDGVEIEYSIAKQKRIPFVTHLGEGFDEESYRSLESLKKQNGLGEFSVLVHCLPFGSKEAKEIAEANASLVWCPSSNLHIFGKTTNIEAFIDAKVNISLGTDLAMAGSDNLLAEMKVAFSILQETKHKKSASQNLFQMMTINAARALRLDSSLGSVETGKFADFFLLKKKHEDPYENLLKAESEDIVLLVKEGKPIFGSGSLESLFQELHVASESILLRHKESASFQITGSPKKIMKKLQTALGYKKDLAFLPIVE
ncbi:MAG: amidohydrolase family protein [Leptospira sp.]|nr:amidohydrolase family protein [Leptospira sp.]NCS92800.1 amidohydrolase family protein [Leptospira sp.]